MCKILIGRCDDVDQGTCIGPTPRESHMPYDSLRFLDAWPADDSKFGPDFNANALQQIQLGTTEGATRHNAVSLAQSFLDSSFSSVHVHVGLDAKD